MKVYISQQRARAFGRYPYHMAQIGRLSLVTWHGQQYWLGYVTTQGYYLTAAMQAA